MPSSNKSKKPQDRKQPSSKKRYGRGWSNPLTDLEMPSGEVCQVKRPGVQGLIEAGVLHSMDTLTTIVQTETIPKAEGRPVKNDVQSVIDDPTKFTEMMNVVDDIVAFVVVQPKVFSDRVKVLDENDKPVLDGEGEETYRKIADEEREALMTEWSAAHPDIDPVFTDWIDAVDKMFIMNFAVGGSRDLQQFREATQATLGGLPTGEAASE